MKKVNKRVTLYGCETEYKNMVDKENAEKKAKEEEEKGKELNCCMKLFTCVKRKIMQVGGTISHLIHTTWRKRKICSSNV